MITHQFVDRNTFALCTEELYLDRLIGFLYSGLREQAPFLFRLLTSRTASSILAFLNYDMFLTRRISGVRTFIRKCGIDTRECLDLPELLDTPKKIFERKIRYWVCRPMPGNESVVASPADARMLVGSLSKGSQLFLKDKFFSMEELLAKQPWTDVFQDCDFAVFRLTPERYHYNHVPVSGKVVDFYEVAGRFHSCNPAATIEIVTPYSKNRRVVTIIDTDVPGGSRVGMVAMVEVVALMIGRVRQAYSEHAYDAPQALTEGMFVRRGCPKSLYEPGSSTDVLLFQPGRIRFDEQIVRNMALDYASSRFTQAFGKPLLETDVKVRSGIGRARGCRSVSEIKEE